MGGDAEHNGVPKSCFVICPIGKDGSRTRLRSDMILELVIKPAVERINKEGEYEIKIMRADMYHTQGNIPSQIAILLVTSDIVISDMTDENPNVFFEMGIREAIYKPIIPIVHYEQDLKFDVNQHRAIKYNHEDVNNLMQCSEQIETQMISILKGKMFNHIIDMDHYISENGSFIPRWKIMKMSYDLLESIHASMNVQPIIDKPVYGDEFVRKERERQDWIVALRESDEMVPDNWRFDFSSEIYLKMKQAEDDERYKPFRVGDKVKIEMLLDSPYNGQVGIVASEWRHEHHYWIKFDTLEEKAFHVMYLTHI